MKIDLEKLTACKFIRQIEYSHSMGSTNAVALQLRSPETPSLVVCDDQSGGRGRGSNQWKSSEDNLAFSLVVDLPNEISVANRLLLSPLAALAVCKTLEQYHSHDPFLIKWPNDVLVCERKICGILIEAAQHDLTPEFTRFVIGCGINVNAPMISEDEFSAISLNDILGSQNDKTDLLVRFLDSFSELHDRLVAGDCELINEIRQRCFLTGKQVQILQGERTISGVCLGFSDTGALLVKNDSGEHSVLSGTVESYSNKM